MLSGLILVTSINRLSGMGFQQEVVAGSELAQSSARTSSPLFASVEAVSGIGRHSLFVSLPGLSRQSMNTSASDCGHGSPEQVRGWRL